MAKIVIIAPADTDLDDAVKLLKGAGNDVDTEEPTPKALLHIVMGLLSANAYGFGPEYAVVAGATAAPIGDKDDPTLDDAGGDDTPAPDDAGGGDDDVSSADFNFESLDLGKVTVDGELIEAKLIDSDTSKLCVENLYVGPRTAYSLNESKFSFWPGDESNPIQQVDLTVNEATTPVNIAIRPGEHGKPTLQVGRDLASMFEGAAEALRAQAMQTPDNKKAIKDLKDQVTALQKDKTKDNSKAVLKLQAKINKLLDSQ